MGEVTIIGVDLAKNVFQVHGAAADGSVLFRKKLSRPQFARFMAEQPPCLVAMEACASAHHWAREMARHGHQVRLIEPHYVKPFLKRQKNDAADAEAIVEAALREDMKKLAGSVSSAAGHRKQALSRDVTDGMTEAAEYVGRKGHDVEARLEHAVTANPLRALGLSVAIGLILGALWRR
jgi:transposase